MCDSAVRSESDAVKSASCSLTSFKRMQTAGAARSRCFGTTAGVRGADQSEWTCELSGFRDFTANVSKLH